MDFCCVGLQAPFRLKDSNILSKHHSALTHQNDAVAPFDYPSALGLHRRFMNEMR